MNRLDQLLEFLREDPTDPFTRFALAAEYEKRGALDRALHCFEELRGDVPSYVGTYYHLGKLYERLGRLADAVETYEAGIEQANRAHDFHSRSELRSALDQVQGGGNGSAEEDDEAY